MRGIEKIKIIEVGNEASHSHRESILLKQHFCKYCDNIKISDSSVDSDLIIFVGEGGMFQEEIRSNSIYRQHVEKCIIFCSSDNAIPILPGLYASLDRRYYDINLHGGGFYVEDTDLDLIHKSIDPKVRYLFSFMGNCNTHRIRGEILQLASHERALFKDVGDRAQAAWSKWDMKRMKQFSKEYSTLIQESKFVICPRGNGTTSIRLFETMKLGRVPVIISDYWVPPSGPDWNQFSVRVQENDIQNIPLILEGLEHQSREMGQIAEKEWNNWFSDKGCINSIMNFFATGKSSEIWNIHGFYKITQYSLLCKKLKYYLFVLTDKFNTSLERCRNVLFSGRTIKSQNED